jgi:hypothetical protein
MTSQHQSQVGEIASRTEMGETISIIAYSVSKVKLNIWSGLR